MTTPIRESGASVLSTAAPGNEAPNNSITAPNGRGGPRVLMVTPRYFPFMGGVETHVYEVARRLAGLGADVTVLTTDPTGRLAPTEHLQGVRILRVPAWPRVEDFYFAPGIYRTIREGGWDVVHIQGIHTFVPVLGMLSALRAGIPYTVTFHTGGHSSALRHRLRAAQWRTLRPLLARAARLIGVSQFEADLFRTQLHLNRRKFTVIPNGSNLPKPEGRPGGSAGDGALIVSVGRLEQYKGHHRVIAALPHVLERRPEARLKIVGKGPYEKALRLIAQELGVADRVEIGSISASDRGGMSTVLSGASLVTLLSEYEAHPIAVMEALSLGRPVLAADTSGLRELAQKGLISAIPLESTPHEVGEAILQQLGQAHLTSNVQLPTWDDCAAMLLSLYRDIAREAGKKSCAY